MIWSMKKTKMIVKIYPARLLFIPRLNQKCSYGDVSMLTYQ